MIGIFWRLKYTSGVCVCGGGERGHCGVFVCMHFSTALIFHSHMIGLYD